MTSLSRNNMRLGWRMAGRAMTLGCGHKIAKGTVYFVFDDYHAYTKYHRTQCRECKGKE